MAASRDFDERSGDVNAVSFVMNRLNAANSGIKLIPTISMNVLTLLACVSEYYTTTLARNS
jgi:hypothetical protein